MPKRLHLGHKVPRYSVTGVRPGLQSATASAIQVAGLQKFARRHALPGCGSVKSASTLILSFCNVFARKSGKMPNRHIPRHPLPKEPPLPRRDTPSHTARATKVRTKKRDTRPSRKHRHATPPRETAAPARFPLSRPRRRRPTPAPATPTRGGGTRQRARKQPFRACRPKNDGKSGAA